MTGLRLKLFGEFQLGDGGGDSVPIPGRKAQALLTYLALTSGQRESREKLADLLWGDRSDEQAMHSLRQCLSSIRKVLEPGLESLLIAEGHVLALNGEQLSIDVCDFERFAVSENPEDLEAARELYAGDLLGGLQTRSEPFDEWLALESQRLRQLAVGCRERLALKQESLQLEDQAIAAALDLVAFDPTCEEGYRILMRLYSRTGHRAEAIRQYRICEAALRRELDVEPDAKTTQLYDDIHDREYEPADVPSDESRLERQTSTLKSPSEKLRSLLAVTVVLILMAAGGLFVLVYQSFWGDVFRDKPDTMRPARPTIVVLPFANLDSDQNQGAFVDGLTEGITTALSVVSDMFVIARNSALTYKGRSVKAEEVAAELGVRYVVDGSVQTDRDRVRVTVYLVDSTNGSQIWADVYDREIGDVFRLQDEIILEIITALQVEMTEGEQDRVSLIHGTKNLRAWILAGQALQHLRRLNRFDNAKARRLYKEAIDLDPNYPGAWGGLAWTHFLDSWLGWSASPEQSILRAGEIAEKTLALDPERPRTYGLLGSLQLMAGNHDQAVALGEKAVELNPNGADVAALLALTLTYDGDLDRSEKLIKNAMRLSPFYPDWFRWTLGRAYRLSDRPEEAIQVLTAGGHLEPVALAAKVELAAAYEQAGDFAGAEQQATLILRQRPTFSARVWTMVPPYRDPATAERDLGVLMRAGLPE